MSKLYSELYNLNYYTKLQKKIIEIQGIDALVNDPIPRMMTDEVNF